MAFGILSFDGAISQRLEKKRFGRKVFTTPKKTALLLELQECDYYHVGLVYGRTII